MMVRRETNNGTLSSVEITGVLPLILSAFLGYLLNTVLGILFLTVYRI